MTVLRFFKEDLRLFLRNICDFFFFGKVSVRPCLDALDGGDPASVVVVEGLRADVGDVGHGGGGGEDEARFPIGHLHGGEEEKSVRVAKFWTERKIAKLR